VSFDTSQRGEVLAEKTEKERWASIEALASTLGVQAACGHTYRPEELLARGHDGAPMLAMKLVKGTSWRELLHGGAGDEVDWSDSGRARVR
jgi:hypothetical protein